MIKVLKSFEIWLIRWEIQISSKISILEIKLSPEGGDRDGDTVMVTKHKGLVAFVKAIDEAVSALDMAPAKAAKEALQEEA